MEPDAYPIEPRPMIIALMMTASCGRLLTSLSTRSSRSSRSIVARLSMPGTNVNAITTKSKRFQPASWFVKTRSGRHSSAITLTTNSKMKMTTMTMSSMSSAPFTPGSGIGSCGVRRDG